MNTQTYSVNQHLIETILTWVKSDEIAIPEIQRPFVWDASKVRDLVDSLYHGYPIGYLIAWRNPNVRLKDGKIAEGKKVLIDGQQRVTALSAAILGQSVINTDYNRVRIKIAFHPLEQKFEVFNPAIEKDVAWIPDIAPVITGEERTSKLVKSYCENNPSAKAEAVEDVLEDLKQIVKKQVGLIELDSTLDIETVTEIFVRINSQGVVLSQADFAMSKIAANQVYGGALLRKCIDFFCHLAVAPEFYTHIVDIDKEFAQSEYFQKISWLKTERDDLYDPKYTDLLRVAFTSEFNRGKLADLVSLLSGRNFEKRTFEEAIAEQSFASLKQGVSNFVNETNFKRFVMIIRSAGFVSSDMVRSQNVMNFAYIFFLKLRAMDYNPALIERLVRRWFVLSILTERYSGSPESMFDLDIRKISSEDPSVYLRNIEAADLSEAFWTAAFPQKLDSSVASSPFFNVFLASQVKANDKGFLSRDITVNDMIANMGDIHHIFPKDYLKKKDMKKGQYNQIANYVYMQTEINIKVGNKSPKDYFSDVLKQCDNGKQKYGGIDSLDMLKNNLAMNCIPEKIFEMDADDYEEFLALRRGLIADKVKGYYESL